MYSTQNLLTGQERLDLLRFLDEAAVCRDQAGFFQLVRGPVRDLLPHCATLAAVLRLSSGQAVPRLRWGIDFPEDYLAQMAWGHCLEARGLLTRWFKTRKPQTLDLTLDPDCLPPSESAMIARYDLRNVAAHGVIDIEGGACSWFRFWRLPAPPGEREARLLVRMVPMLHQALIQSVASVGPVAAPGVRLTAREVEILLALVAGQGSRDMAQARGTSPRTLQTQLSSIFRKLGVSNRVAAIAKTREIGLDSLRPVDPDFSATSAPPS